MKKLLIVFFAAVTVLSSSLIGYCSAYPEATKDFYAADYGDVLSDSTEKFIVANSKQLCDKTKAQVVVATVKDMGGKIEREYALEIGRKLCYNKIGI